MKNITLSIDEELYRKSRVAAAEADTSVTALVREFLTRFTGSEAPKDIDDRGSQASRRVLEIVQTMRGRHPGFRAGDRLTRDEIHSREYAIGG